MVIVRRIPYRSHFGLEQQLRDMQRRVASLSQVTSQPPAGGADEHGTHRSSSFNPSVDVYREDDELVLEFELPGVDVDNDLDVSVHDGIVTVKGSRSSERSEKRGGVYLTERRSGSFSRSMTLPDGVEADDIKADYADGVLSIRMVVPDEGSEPSEPRQISIGRRAPKQSEADRDTGTGNDDAEGRGLDAGNDARTTSTTDDASETEQPAAEQASAKSSGPEKSTASKSTANKSTAKKSVASESNDNKSTADKSTAKKATAKKTGTKQAASKKTGTKQADAKKTGTKKAAAKKTGTKGSSDQ